MEGSNSNSKILWIFLWAISLLFVGGVAYAVGSSRPTPIAQKTQEETITPLPTSPQEQAMVTIIPSPTVTLTGFCDKSGPSQKKDYLKSYILKGGDSFQKIAENELHDPTRVSELTALNEDQQKLTVGSTIFLPPDSIKQSGGHIFETSGKIVKKDEASWQLSYGGGEKGMGIVFPGFWFKDLTDAASFKLGDCVTILFDNGVKVYSVKKN